MSSKYVQKNKKTNHVSRRIKNIIAWLLIPITLFYSYGIYSNLFNSFTPLIYRNISKIIIILLVVIFVPKIFGYLKAFFKRAALIKHLHEVCKEKGFRYIKIHSPILSIFYKNDDAEIVVVTKENAYAVNFFPCLSKHKALDFNSENTLTLKYTILKAFPIRKKKNYFFNDVSDTDILSLSLPIMKILLINPVSYKITATTNRGSIIVDNYEKMFGYIFFTGTGFCNMLDRL
jgi:hypothetical protein